MKLFSIEIRCCIINSSLNLINSVFNFVAVACAVNDNGIFLCNLNLTSLTEHLHCSIFKFKTEIGGNYLTACKNCDILKHIFSSVTKARSFNAYASKCASEFIKKDCLKSFALNVLCNNYEFLTALKNRLKKRKNILN